MSATTTPAEVILVTLPYPPSGNNRLMAARGRLITAPAFRTWRDRAAVALAQQLRGVKRPIGPRTAVSITVVEPTEKYRRDIDNVVKPALDALVRAGVIADDCLVDALEVRRDGRVDGGELRITVTALA